MGLTLFGATTNGGQFSDPRDTKALYRYLSGTNSAATGDDECNVGDVKVTKICFINQGSSADMRFFQASGGPDFSLAPGAFSSIVVAYIFSAPVKSGACTGPSVCGSIQPQIPTGSLTRMLTVDTISEPGALLQHGGHDDRLQRLRGRHQRQRQARPERARDPSPVRCWARRSPPRRCSTPSSRSRCRRTRRPSTPFRAATRSPSSGSSRPPKSPATRTTPRRRRRCSTTRTTGTST